MISILWPKNHNFWDIIKKTIILPNFFTVPLENWKYKLEIGIAHRVLYSTNEREMEQLSEAFRAKGGSDQMERVERPRPVDSWKGNWLIAAARPPLLGGVSWLGVLFPDWLKLLSGTAFIINWRHLYWNNLSGRDQLISIETFCPANLSYCCFK